MLLHELLQLPLVGGETYMKVSITHERTCCSKTSPTSTTSGWGNLHDSLITHERTCCSKTSPTPTTSGWGNLHESVITHERTCCSKTSPTPTTSGWGNLHESLHNSREDLLQQNISNIYH